MVFNQRKIERLRDRLLERGSASVVPEPFSRSRPEGAAAYDRIQPFAEAMFLVMSADADISQPERDVLRGAVRTLSEGELGTAATDAMIADLETKLARDGFEVRMDSVAAFLWPDPRDQELALALAAATAAADGRIDPVEKAAILDLAERLGMSQERVLGLVAEGRETNVR